MKRIYTNFKLVSTEQGYEISANRFRTPDCEKDDGEEITEYFSKNDRLYKRVRRYSNRIAIESYRWYESMQYDHYIFDSKEDWQSFPDVLCGSILLQPFRRYERELKTHQPSDS